MFVACVGLGTLVPGCPQVLTDDFYVQRSSVQAGQGSTDGGAAGMSATGATWAEAGAGGEAGDSAAGGTTFAEGGTAAIGGDSTMGGDSTNAGGTDATGGDSTVAGGTDATGGDSTVAGGTTATGGESTVEGGMTATGGKSWNSGGRTATGGTSATGGATSSPYGPLCASSVVKDGSCTGGAQPCYKTCGPSSIGFKSETCIGGTYSEQSNCSFPVGPDYSCYKVPAVRSSACPSATVPRAGQACTVAQCTVCFGGTLAAPTYQDSTGTQKNGYCVCLDTGTWTCASTTSWPCPGSAGCY